MKFQILAKNGEVVLRGSELHVSTAPSEDADEAPFSDRVVEAIRTAVLTPDRAGEAVEEEFEVNTNSSIPVERFDKETAVGFGEVDDDTVTINLRDRSSFQ